MSARFIDLLREILITQLAGCAAEIADAGHSHPDRGIERELLMPFDAHRALVEQVGWVPRVPPVAAEVDLDEHRDMLAKALRKWIEFERYLCEVDRERPDGDTQRRRMQRRTQQIRAFMSAADLQEDEGRAAPSKAAER